MSEQGGADDGVGAPGADDALQLIERLDVENEHYMRVTMDLRNLLEDAVIREVALEREVAVLRRRIAQLQGGLDAVMATTVMRVSRPARVVWSRVRTSVRRG
jgi:hypothetical protein